MGTTAGLRQRIADLLTGATGSGAWAIPTALGFHPVMEGRTVETHDVDTVERVFDVQIRDRQSIGPVNPLNGYGLYKRTVMVRVGYQRTQHGGDLVEHTGEQSGPGTENAIEDRADADRHLIEAVVGYLGNWASIPGVQVIALIPGSETGASGGVTFNDSRGYCAIPFTLTSRDALPGAYGPAT